MNIISIYTRNSLTGLGVNSVVHNRKLGVREHVSFQDTLKSFDKKDLLVEKGQK